MNELFYNLPYVWITISGLLGLALGSFINSFVWRGAQSQLIPSKRSVCIHCRRTLAWHENIPLLSFIFLQGKCRTCQKPIPWHYPLVEALTMLSFVAASWFSFHQHFSPIHLLRDLIFIFILITIFVSDGLYQHIPSSILTIGIISGFILNYFFLSYPLASLLIAAGVAGGFFLLQFFVSRGKWIGSGDIFMGIMMGIWLSWPNILVALLISYTVGALIGIFLLFTKQKKADAQIAFGTFLAIGTMVSLYWGNTIIKLLSY